MAEPAGPPTRIGYLGPEGTFSHAAALSGGGAGAAELVPLATIYEVVMAVAAGDVDRAVVPIENSIEGSVSATLDTLATEARAVRIVAEQVEPIEQCLIAAAAVELAEITTVLSHPQASGQCARYLREHLPHARVMSTSSTAEAVATVAQRGAGWAALGPRLAAERYGAQVLAEGVEDRHGNETRFVWLAAAPAESGAADLTPAPAAAAAERSPWKTSILFWGDGSGRPGWLVRCLSELADRGVNMTRIESRPRKRGLGEYMFFVDCEGTAADPEVTGALAALAGHVETLSVLGSYPAATLPPPSPPVDFRAR